jgi:hypothetical protein
MTTSDLLTTAQVAAALGITRQGVHARIKAGTLTPVYTPPTNRSTLLFTADAVEPVTVTS